MSRLTSVCATSTWIAGRRALLHALGLIAVAVPLLTAATGAAQANESVRVEVQVWQHPANPGDTRVGALPADGSWPAPEMIALTLDDGISSSGRHRYGDISIEVQWRIGAAPVTVEVRVWQHVEDGRDLHVSARGSLGSWRTLGTVPLALSDDGHGPQGRFRAGRITIKAPLPTGETGAPLRYRFDPAGEATEPGSYAFLTGPVASPITTYEGFRRDAAALRVNAVAEDGSSSQGLFSEVEPGHLIEWYWRYDCFVRYRVTDVGEVEVDALFREFGVRSETYVFQSCQSGSLPADGSTAAFSAAPEMPLQHLGGTSLTSFAVVHGPWQITPGMQPAPLAAPEPSDANLTACVAEGAVPDPAVQPALVRDCAVLLDALDTLLGDTGLANWSAERPIAEWNGVKGRGIAAPCGRVVGTIGRSRRCRASPARARATLGAEGLGRVWRRSHGRDSHRAGFTRRPLLAGPRRQSTRRQDSAGARSTVEPRAVVAGGEPVERGDPSRPRPTLEPAKATPAAQPTDG